MDTSNKSSEEELETALMEVFNKVAEFGRVFLTSASKEEFLESINEGALDPQEAAYVSMALVSSYTEQKVKEAVCKEFEDASDFAEDVLQQFGYNGKSGGLSTLEWAEAIIKRYSELTNPNPIEEKS